MAGGLGEGTLGVLASLQGRGAGSSARGRGGRDRDGTWQVRDGIENSSLVPVPGGGGGGDDEAPAGPRESMATFEGGCGRGAGA